MEYNGQVRGGVVVFESEKPPEGATVRVEVVEQHTTTAEGGQGGELWSKLLEVAGTAEGLPPDMAEQHNHYIHGTPKRK